MHLDWTFWALVLGIAVWRRVAPIRRTTAFGLTNVLALAILVGPQAAVAAVSMAIGLWVWLWLATSRHGGTARVARRLAYVLPVAVFFAYKVAVDLPGLRSWIAGSEPLPRLHALLVALSFSYAALRCVDAAHCVIGKGVSLLDPVGLTGYLFPFHMLLAGPIGAYDQHVRLDGVKPLLGSLDELLGAVNDVSTGLIYKHVCAEYLRVFLFGPDAPLGSQGLADTAVLFVYLFFDFAGYSRIAQGAGTWMGVPTPQNFRAPFAARNVTEFFALWHMSLGGWVLRNVYVPLQLGLVRRFGVRNALRLALVTLIVSWLFVGLWHRVSWRFAVYGVTFAAVVWLEKLILERRWVRPAKAGTIKWWVRRGFGMAYVFVTVTLMLHIVMNELLRP